MTSMKILYAGQLDPFGTCYSRLNSLKKKTDSIVTFAADGFYEELSRYPRHTSDLHFAALARNWTTKLLDECERSEPNILWLDTGEWLTTGGIRELKSRRVFLVRHMTDALYPKRRPILWLRRYRLRNTTPKFDLVFTSNERDHEFLTRRMADRVCLTDLAYDHQRFRPLTAGEEIPAKLKPEASFVGHYEPRTEEFLAHLVKAGLSVTVYGHQPWFNRRTMKKLGKSLQPRLSNLEYEQVLRGTKIGICCVSEWNYNQTAARSFEIPASGTFLLAMRTPRHQQFFEEGREAEFFSTPDELVEKTKFYLENPEKREAIAAAGYQRCLNSGYSWDAVTARDFEKLAAAYDRRETR